MTAILAGQADPQKTGPPFLLHEAEGPQSDRVRCWKPGRKPQLGLQGVSPDHAHYRDHLCLFLVAFQNKVKALSKALDDTQPSPLTPPLASTAPTPDPPLQGTLLRPHEELPGLRPWQLVSHLWAFCSGYLLPPGRILFHNQQANSYSTFKTQTQFFLCESSPDPSQAVALKPGGGDF